MRKLLSLIAVLVVSMLSLVSALDETNDLTVDSVEINDNQVNFVKGEVLSVEEGQTLEIEVGLKAIAGVENIEVEAEISGYEYSDYENLEDSTNLFDIAALTTKYVNLEVALPTMLEKSEYWLRLRIMGKTGAVIQKDIKLAVEPSRHGLDIADVVLSPGNSQKAGKSFLATVLLENFGDKTEKDVKVTVAIPALGVSATEFVDVIETDNNNVEYEDVPEMFLPLPANAQGGEYDLVVTAKYDNLMETVTQTMKVSVVVNEMFQTSDKLVLAYGPESQTVAAGSKATYAIALTNAGASSKAYMLEAVAGDWAKVALSESLVVLEAGKNKVVYVDVAVAGDAPVGEHSASVVVKSNDNVLETLNLKAKVVAASAPAAQEFSLRNGLEVALIILVVLLVIIGLIVGFSRLKKDEDEEEKTYY